jgi:hypothetical protein
MFYLVTVQVAERTPDPLSLWERLGEGTDHGESVA